MSATRRRRWIDVLRRPGAADEAAVPRRALDDAGLWRAHDQASRALDESSALAEKVAASVARQRGVIDGAAERAGMASARAEGLGAGAARVVEAFERLGVVALNAGLEGARLPDPHGRALLLISDEIRANVTRGADAARELGGAVEEVATETGEVRRQLERSRSEVGEVGQEAARLRALAHEASTALADLGDRLQKATGTDPEVARAIEAAADHARGLMAALSTLSTAAQSTLAQGALAPVLAPLARLLAEGAELPGDDARGGAAGKGEG